ncbi:sensor histidine kinase [Sunxiuqinia sp. A32]|uniref:sensor histidine kinase n=1 Tax=Sunxiuqinia sp. A32 TaxID=3461496 RepID=UPI004045D81D
MKQSFTLNIVVRILIVAVVSFGIGWSFFELHSIVFGIFLCLVNLGVIINLVNYQNSVNERISYFFEAVKNGDFSQLYPNIKGDKIINKLNQNLNEVNQQIQQIKIESQQQDQYFRAVIEHVGTGILTYDEKGFVIHANSALKKILGMEHFTHLKQLERVDSTLLNSFRQVQERDQKLISFSGKQGKVNLAIKANAFKNRERNLVLLSVQDINRELDEKELDSWLKLIRVLTHEIMNSIAPVTSLSESLSSYFQKDGVAISPEEINEKVISTTIRGLEVIKEQGRGLITFVESYRKLTRLPKPEKKRIPVKDLFDKIILLNKVENQNSSIQLNVQIESPDFEIFADEKLISQVLLNLMKNSREALTDKANGQITLIAGRNRNGQHELCVKDNGPGISKELLDEIFVPFFTTRENGSGIGLSLSRQIMRLHGGALLAKSIPGEETVFCMRFQ